MAEGVAKYELLEKDIEYIKGALAKLTVDLETLIKDNSAAHNSIIKNYSLETVNLASLSTRMNHNDKEIDDIHDRLDRYEEKLSSLNESISRNTKWTIATVISTLSLLIGALSLFSGIIR